MAVTAKAQAKLRFYLAMLVGNLIIAVVIGAMTVWSFALKAVTAFTVLFWALPHSLNRRSSPL